MESMTLFAIFAAKAIGGLLLLAFALKYPIVAIVIFVFLRNCKTTQVVPPNKYKSD